MSAGQRFAEGRSDPRSWPRRWLYARQGGRCASCGTPLHRHDPYWNVAVPSGPAVRFCSVACDEAATRAELARRAFSRPYDQERDR